MSLEFREDCLIDMLRLSEGKRSVSLVELSEFMNVPADDIRRTMASLNRDGMISGSDELAFTEEGLNYAREIRKKHHVMENFLVNVLGMDHQAAHNEAHKMEHSLSQESMQRLCHVTGNKIDADCSACSNPCDSVIHINNSMLLDEMPLHKHGKIGHLKSTNPEDVKKLISMGFVPGREVFVESKVSGNGPRVVRLGESVVALDANLTKLIYVNVDA